jgi:tetratricopeptide (TPR) repeat protein
VTNAWGRALYSSATIRCIKRKQGNKLKRSLVFGLFFVAVSSLVAFFGGQADAARAKASPAPSATPSALPTATPEPPDKAIPRLLTNLKTNPNDRDSLGQLAEQYLSIGRPDLALPLTQKLLALGSRTAQTYYFDGFANEQLGRVPQSVADYEQAANLDPTNIGVLGALTQVYLKTNRLADAERIAKRAVTFNKTDKRAYVNYGLVLATQNKFDDARVQLEAAYKMDPTDITPLLQVGQTYVSQNAFPNALATVARAIAADPKNPQAYLFKADILAKQHDVVNALSAYEQAVSFAADDDQRAGIVDREAGFLASEKKSPEAQATFQRAIDRYPTVLSAHLTYGDYWNQQNQTGKAVAEWTAALGPNKDNPAALLRLGTYNLRSGHISQAVDYLKLLAQASPDQNSFNLLGQAYTYNHDYSRAKDSCRQAYQIQPNAPALGCIAGADYELKNYKESATIFDVLDARLHSFLDQNGQLLFIAGRVYERTNQKGKALTEYKRLLALMRPGTAAYKQVQQSIKDLSKAKKQHA